MFYMCYQDYFMVISDMLRICSFFGGVNYSRHSNNNSLLVNLTVSYICLCTEDLLISHFWTDIRGYENMKRGLLHTEGLPKYFLYTIFTILNKIFLLHKIFCCGFKKQSQRQLIYIVRLVKIKKLTLAVLEDETL